MQLWEKFKFGIFDVDGTLFDNMALSAGAFCEILKIFNLPQNEVRKIYLETNGMNLNDQFKLVLDKYGTGYNESAIQSLHNDFFETRDNSPEWQNSFLFPGVKKLLEKLRANGVKNFVSSGSNTDEIV
jgi:phosphoglycolate phosphatase-like HAD superfamily hydrolase